MFLGTTFRRRFWISQNSVHLVEENGIAADRLSRLASRPERVAAQLTGKPLRAGEQSLIWKGRIAFEDPSATSPYHVLPLTSPFEGKRRFDRRFAGYPFK